MKVVEVTSENVVFDNGAVLTYRHERDCCERVYADFLALKDYNALGKNANKTIFDVDFDETSIRLFSAIVCVVGEGFKVEYADGDFVGSAFVPCYNEQNGYYMSDLELVYIKDGKEISVDISDCVKDVIF